MTALEDDKFKTIPIDPNSELGKFFDLVDKKEKKEPQVKRPPIDPNSELGKFLYSLFKDKVDELEQLKEELRKTQEEWANCPYNPDRKITTLEEFFMDI